MMWADWDADPTEPDETPRVVGPVRPSSGTPAQPESSSATPARPGPRRRTSSFSKRLDRALLGIGILIAVGCVAVGTGLITLPGDAAGPSTTQASAQSAAAAQRAAANRQWASAVCTNVLAWKNQIKHDESLDLGFGPVARVQNAIASTKHMLSQLDKLGLPPSVQTGPARAETQQLRSEIESRVAQLENAANGVAGGNLLAIGNVISDLNSDKVLAPQLVTELRHVISIDLGLSLAETRSCRALVGVPF